MYRSTVHIFVSTILPSLIFYIYSTANASNIHSFPKCDQDSSSEYHEIIPEPQIVISNDDLKRGHDSRALEHDTDQWMRLSTMTTCPDSLKLSISGFNRKFVINLVKNEHLISDNYFKSSTKHINHRAHSRYVHKHDDEFHDNNLFLNLHGISSFDDHCHYHGHYSDNYNSAISIVDHQSLSGMFYSEDQVYILSPNSMNSSTILTKSTSCSVVELSRNILEAKSLKSLSIKTARASRESSSSRLPFNASSESRVLHEPFMSNSSSYYVEMLVVHDHSQYIEYEKNTSLIAERTMQIVNIMNAFYRQLNIFISLVGIVLWVEKDEIQLTEDGDSTLTNFLKYRYEKLLPKYHHNSAQLITSTSFNGSVVGKALKGTICTHEHSGGVNTDHSHIPAVVAVTLAHELGHNFGMEHDEDEKCKCPDDKCIMSSSSSNLHPKHWSSCSIDYLEEAKKHGLLDCLIQSPEKIYGPVCGNGFVEEGEDCDLGELLPTTGISKSRNRQSMANCSDSMNCDPVPPVNSCCDRRTCKFVGNATCAQGPCCDLSKCSVYNSTDRRICRPRRGDCDLEEICDGHSEYCPVDVYYHDGIECGPTTSLDGKLLEVGSLEYNRTRAYCYKGKCASHESQCNLLWGPTAYTSDSICYEQNIHGNTSGHCGYNRRDKLYNGCEPENAICGMLHCVHHQPSTVESRKTGKLGYGFESSSILTVSFFVMYNQSRIYCHGAIIDAGPDVRDPGLVPNGALCGEDKMCLNQKCVPVYEVIYKNWCPSDCSGNGVCDNLGVCHCNDGTIGSSCYQFFGSNFHLSLVLYMLMFFVPVIVLIILAINHYRGEIKIWWFLYNRRIALRDKARATSLSRRTPYEVDRGRVTISEPIPLNQHNNVNRPFYDPTINPWSETDCDVGQQSVGYRLQPLRTSGMAGGSELTSNRVAMNLQTEPRAEETKCPARPVRAAPVLPPGHK